jgi:hypothetical protein
MPASSSVMRNGLVNKSFNVIKAAWQLAKDDPRSAIHTEAGMTEEQLIGLLTRNHCCTSPNQAKGFIKQLFYEGRLGMDGGLYFPEVEEAREEIAKGEADAVFQKFAAAKTETVDKTSIQYNVPEEASP